MRLFCRLLHSAALYFRQCNGLHYCQIFDKAGLHFDASSGYEIHRAIKAGISPQKVSLSSQEFPVDFADLYPLGIEFNACSLSQLKRFGQLFPGASCGLRFNPGVGSGGTEKTNVGGPSSSFGIWHEQIAEVKVPCVPVSTSNTHYSFIADNSCKIRHPYPKDSHPYWLRVGSSGMDKSCR
jgi:hypothetical protein